jgi:hypothetical protein
MNKFSQSYQLVLFVSITKVNLKVGSVWLANKPSWRPLATKIIGRDLAPLHM